MKQPSSISWYKVNWQRPFVIEDVYSLLTHLSVLTPRGFIIWETRCRNGEVTYLLGTDPRFSGKLKELYLSHGEIEFTEIPSSIRNPVEAAVQIKPSVSSMALDTEASENNIKNILSSLTNTRTGYESVVQVIIGSATHPTSVDKNVSSPNTSWINVVLGSAKRADQETLKSMREKSAQHGFACSIRVGIGRDYSESKNAVLNFPEPANNSKPDWLKDQEARRQLLLDSLNGNLSSNHSASEDIISRSPPIKGLLKGRLDNIVSSFKTLEAIGVRINASTCDAMLINNATIPWQLKTKLSVKELAICMLLPAGETELPGVSALHPVPLIPPKWYKPKEDKSKKDTVHRFFADSMNSIPISINAKDSLEHTHIIGPTGCGKSTLMLNLIMADINAGRSVLVIDPKADLVRDVLARIPNDRVGDVVIIDPSSPAPTGFNPLAFTGFRHPSLIADVIFGVLQEVFHEYWGIKTADILTAALNTLAQTKDSSILSVQPLLTDKTYRDKIVSGLTDKIGLIPFWENFESMKESERRTDISPVLNKLRQISLRPELRNVLGQAHPKFDFMDLFYKRKIVLVPLNKGQIGPENAKLLGSLIVGVTWTLALMRTSIPPEKRHIISVFIDELQDYIALPTDLSDALAQARGLSMGLTLAHQYRDQLPSELRSGVDANTLSKIVFPLNAPDAKEMATMMPDLEPLDVMSLKRHHVYTNVKCGDNATGWVMAKTRPSPPEIRDPNEIREINMKTYGRTHDEVEAELVQMFYGDRSNTSSPEVSTETASGDAGTSDAPNSAPGVGRKKKNEI